MSEKLTRIRLPGSKAYKGLLDWGDKLPDEMIIQARSYAAHLRAQAEEIEAAADSEFQIDVVRGSLVQHHLREVQKSSRHNPRDQPSQGS